MIRKIEIKDFESHKHTVFEFGAGFNCIHGKSNNGKSSALRAIELAGYGIWAAGENKKKGIHGPVRIGAKFCEIFIETDLGSVLTRRGKGVNEWEVVDNRTGKTSSFQNPGSGAIPLAQEIIGLESMTVADQEIRFNWSDQRDKHFLIDEVEGKNSSPSFVAAVLDEVGGLSGCEDLIRSISSEKSKFEQDMKKAGEEISQVEEDLKEFELLDSNLELSKKAETKLKQTQKNMQQAEAARKLKDKAAALKERLKDYKGLAAAEKRLTAAEDKLKELLSKYSEFENATRLNIKRGRISGRLEDAKQSLQEAEKIDIIKVSELLSNVQENMQAAKSAKKMFAQAIRKKAAIEKIPDSSLDFEDLESKISDAKKQIQKLEKIQELPGKLSGMKEKIKNAGSDFRKLSKLLDVKKEELKEIWSSSDGLCPLCKQEVTEDCLKEMISGV
jgi:exonuclease SbcC